ncbi:MAG: hypothetical protein A3E88_01285 [Legionellales bacterium RIFCSPHIGHO2_12_FULL_35_11]|nr:MAG: hypothetical protein A3E88_01285 [Legionellales bacterium RIFCSPHIGHO2_12_FULL_35_11]
MKLVRFGEKGREKPGILDENSDIRDLSAFIKDLDPENLTNSDIFAKIRQLDLLNLPKVEVGVRLGSPIKVLGKLIFIGFNSHNHAKEMGVTIDSSVEPIVFMKPNSVVSGPFDPIKYAKSISKLDWEAELAVVIGKQGKYISSTEVHEHIFGFTCCNDLTDRFLQFETNDKQFTKGKCFDGSAPLGPYLVTKDENLVANNLDIKLWVNDELRQDFNTKDYIRDVSEVVSYVSNFFTLYPGDVISMGSAPGSAASWGYKYLQVNDEIRLEISGLGQQKQKIILE